MSNSQNLAKIEGHIVSAVVCASTTPEGAPQQARILQRIDENMRRPEELTGKTYKLKTPLSESALYIIINNITLNAGTDSETVQPFEIFIVSKDMSNYQWIAAMTRLTSAIFRKGGDVTFVVEELRSVFDPNGGYLKRDGRVPSLVAEIGMVIERHFQAIGLLPSPEGMSVELKAHVEEKKKVAESRGVKGTKCPKCGSPDSYLKLDGCWTCTSCGQSNCG